MGRQEHHTAAVPEEGVVRHIVAVLEVEEDRRIAAEEVEGRPIRESHVSKAR